MLHDFRILPAAVNSSILRCVPAGYVCPKRMGWAEPNATGSMMCLACGSDSISAFDMDNQECQRGKYKFWKSEVKGRKVDQGVAERRGGELSWGTLGFIGLGNMGSGMAGNIQKADYPMVVYDLRQESARPLLTGEPVTPRPRPK